MSDEPPLNKDRLVEQLVKQVGLKRNDARSAVDYVLSALEISKAGGLLADQACNACGPVNDAQA